MSTSFDDIISESELATLKQGLKNKNLKREEISDILFTEALSRMDLEGRLRMLEACMLNDTFRRIRYRKTKIQ